ncbi:MAG TPA: DUF4136 domain-containing protein [Candidatus Limnocylindrales bacterium]|nr:DUF4136 domain-containing protein [Candidatus Limnocylindrales bacterium]
MELRKRTIQAGLIAAAFVGGMALAGCDDNVTVLRDPDVRVAKGMTWAWRPMTPPQTSAKREADDRPVVSRDVITTAPPQQHMESNRDWNTEANRKQLQAAIEHSLNAKGLVQVTDPATADFLVDYHVAVRSHRATVEEVYPGWGWWGWGWGPPEVDFRTVRWHEGTFILDLALRSPRKLAYRAISPKALNNKYTISPYQAEEAVKHLVKGLKVQ